MRENKVKGFINLKTNTLIADNISFSSGAESIVGDSLNFDNNFSYTYTIKKTSVQETPNWTIIYSESATGDIKVDDIIIYDLDNTPKIVVNELYNTFTNSLSDPLVFNVTINSVNNTNVLLDVVADTTKLVITEPTVTITGPTGFGSDSLSAAITTNFTSSLAPPALGFYIGDYSGLGPTGNLTPSAFFNFGSPGVEVNLGFISAFTVRSGNPTTGTPYRIFFTGYEYYLRNGRGELFIKEDFITRIIYDYGGANLDVTIEQAKDGAYGSPGEYEFETYDLFTHGQIPLTDVVTSSELDRVFKNAIKG